MVYSRHFCMDYALFAANHSVDWKTSYLANNSNALGIRFQVREKSPGEYRTAPLVNSIHRYWNMLNRVTIPLLEDIWTICMKRLENYMSGARFDIENMYRTYIDNNIDLLTADFSVINPEERKTIFYDSSKELTKTPDDAFKYINLPMLKNS